jgi:hypothetical protein
MAMRTETDITRGQVIGMVQVRNAKISGEPASPLNWIVKDNFMMLGLKILEITVWLIFILAALNLNFEATRSLRFYHSKGYLNESDSDHDPSKYVYGPGKPDSLFRLLRDGFVLGFGFFRKKHREPG